VKVACRDCSDRVDLTGFQQQSRRAVLLDLSRSTRIALVPLIYPITCDTEYFGGSRCSRPILAVRAIDLAVGKVCITVPFRFLGVSFHAIVYRTSAPNFRYHLFVDDEANTLVECQLPVVVHALDPMQGAS
jgi:hypothetical protein